MFLSDVSENIALFRRKRYEEYLRENKPEIYTSLQNTRKELSDAINKQRVNPSSKKPVIAAVTPKKTKNTYRMIRDLGMGKEQGKNISQGLRDLKRFEPLPNLKNTLPDLSVLKRKQPLPILSNPLPELGSLKRKDEAFNVLAGKHDVTGVVNPVKDTFTTTSGRKPMTELVTPKTTKLSTKDTKKLLKTLGVAGVVSGGLLGAYGLKKYNDARNKDKKR